MSNCLCKALAMFTAVLIQAVLICPAALCESIIVDHTCTDLSQIPDTWLEEAKQLTVHFGHTSHGSQILAGLYYLETHVDAEKYSFALSPRNSERTPVLPAEESPPALYSARLDSDNRTDLIYLNLKGYVHYTTDL